jgi:autotransporter translocation and assembly factor TamB
LRRADDEHEAKEAQRMHMNPSLTMPADRSGEVHEQPVLSEDALIVQTVTADLKRAGVTSDVFAMVQRHGHLREWDQNRWLQAEQELAQARLLQARRHYQAMRITRMQEVMGEGVDEDELPDDGLGTV